MPEQSDKTKADWRRSAFLSFAGFSLYAGGDAVIKHLSTHYALPTILFGGAVAILFILLVFALVSRSRLSVVQPRWHIMRGVLLVIEMSALAFSFAHNSLAQTYAVVFCAPCLTALVARIVWREPISGRQWLAICLGFAGVLIILRPGLVSPNFSVVTALIAAASFAGLNLLAKPAGGSGASALNLAFWPEAIATCCFLPFFLHQPELPHGADWFWFALLGLLSASGFCASSAAFARGPFGLVAPFEYTQMLWAVMFGVLFFHDGLDAWTVIGAAPIIAAGLLLIRSDDVADGV